MYVLRIHSYRWMYELRIHTYPTYPELCSVRRFRYQCDVVQSMTVIQLLAVNVFPDKDAGMAAT